MDKKRLETLLKRSREKADRAFRNYQDTGAYHYEWQYRNADEMSEIIRLALDAADEHTYYISLRSDLANLAHKAEIAIHNPDEIMSVVNNVISLAEAYGVYQRRH